MGFQTVEQKADKKVAAKVDYMADQQVYKMELKMDMLWVALRAAELVEKKVANWVDFQVVHLAAQLEKGKVEKKVNQLVEKQELMKADQKAIYSVCQMVKYQVVQKAIQRDKKLGDCLAETKVDALAEMWGQQKDMKWETQRVETSENKWVDWKADKKVKLWAASTASWQVQNLVGKLEKMMVYSLVVVRVVQKEKQLVDEQV